MLKTVARMAQAKPGLGVPQRTGLLVMSAGRPRSRRRRPVLDRIRVDRRIKAQLTGTTGMALATAPQVALQAGTSVMLGDEQLTPQQRQLRARALLASDVALMAAGVLVQRTAIHGPDLGAVNGVGRTLGRQLAMGGLAGAIVVGTDTLLGPGWRQRLSKSSSAATTGMLIATAQAVLVRRGGRWLTLEEPTNVWNIPVVRDPRGSGLMAQGPQVPTG